MTNYTGVEYEGFIAESAGTYPLWFEVQDHFVCTGSATNDPDWVIVLQTLCSNYWWDVYSGSVTLNAGDTVIYLRDYYNRTTDENFDDYEDGQIVDSASREADELVTTQLYYTVVPGSGGDGGPG